jgi:hypothetical protein
MLQTGVTVTTAMLLLGTGIVSARWMPGRTASAADGSSPSAAVTAQPRTPKPTRPSPSYTTPSGSVRPSDSTGPEWGQAANLMEQLINMVPAGYTVPAGDNSDSGKYLRLPRVFSLTVEGRQMWQYLVDIALQQGKQRGTLSAEVDVPGLNRPTEPCALAQAFWGIGGECQIVTVGDLRVGVVTNPGKEDSAYDQWAAVRHQDGTVVYLAQTRSRESFDDPSEPLATLPFTVQQLASAVVDPRLHLS